MKLPDRAKPIQDSTGAWHRTWRNSPLIKIYDITGCRIAVVPLHFLDRGQIKHGWQHVYEVIACCVEMNNGRIYTPGPLGLIPIDETTWPAPGDYIFSTFGKSILSGTTLSCQAYRTAHIPR